ncbi:Gluconate transport-inducing protein [Sporothrix epigloea]|uniref:Gluconate transport-inducing protein n=1 Tax=Sporothrix epigloea TaxID=1892477 RepID=A0ABP0DQP7_9PEZI
MKPSVQKHPMETYHGMVRSPADAIKLFEACRMGLLPRVQRRLSEKERQAIRSGSVFVWDEREAGMRRWTDGKSWSASRVSGSFLTYREMEGKRGGGGFNTMRRMSGRTPDSSGRSSDDDQDDGEPDGYRYKADGLMKQSFSITTSTGQHLHLISYYARPSPGSPDLPQPIIDPSLRIVVPVKGMYPESSMSDSIPATAVLRVGQSPHDHHHPPPHYAHQQHQQPPPPHYLPGQYSQPGYSWPPSPATTPPYSSQYTTNSAPYPPQPPPTQTHYSQTAPPPPPLGYYAGSPYPSQASYGSAPLPPQAMQYDRVPLPPTQQQAAPARAASVSHSQHPLYNSPPSLYHHTPALPPVSSSSGAGPIPAYQTSPSSSAVRQNSLSVPQDPLPGLGVSAPAVVARALSFSGASSSAAAIAAPPLRRGSSALTPPYQGPTSQKPSYVDAYADEHLSPLTTTAGGKRASLASLLLPTPANSETNGTRSTSSSPRHQFAAPVGPAGATSLAQQYLQPAPSGEDSRALSRLDKKFCI